MAEKPLLNHDMVKHFEDAIRLAFEHEDSISLVTRCLVEAAWRAGISRVNIRDAWERLDA